MALVPLASVPQAGVLLYPGVDLVSSTLPLGVLAGSDAVRAFTVADTDDLIRSRDTLDMKPQFAFADCPALDVLVIPDGFGAHDDPLGWSGSRRRPMGRAPCRNWHGQRRLSNAGFRSARPASRPLLSTEGARV
jgi:hypothetical protein